MRWAAWNGRSVPRSKIDPRSTKKPSARWPAEHGLSGGEHPDRRLRQRRVVGRRSRPDVARGSRDGGADRPVPGPSPRVEGHLGDVVGLLPVPVGAVERGDRAGVVEERVRVRDDGLEPELVDDVRPAVAVVVDLDLVEHVVTELVEVRAAGRRLRREVVRDQGDGVSRRAEGVGVRVVGHRVLRDRRGFAVR